LHSAEKSCRTDRERPQACQDPTPEEKKRLLETAALRSEWQVTYCAAVLALNTTMRSCEIRGLRWKDLDWDGEPLTIRRESTKTNAGANIKGLKSPLQGLRFHDLRHQAITELAEQALSD